MGSFGQSDQVEKCPAHSQTHEKELGDELDIEREINLMLLNLMLVDLLFLNLICDTLLLK